MNTSFLLKKNFSVQVLQRPLQRTKIWFPKKLHSCVWGADGHVRDTTPAWGPRYWQGCCCRNSLLQEPDSCNLSLLGRFDKCWSDPWSNYQDGSADFRYCSVWCYSHLIQVFSSLSPRKSWHCRLQSSQWFQAVIQEGQQQMFSLFPAPSSAYTIELGTFLAWNFFCDCWNILARRGGLMFMKLGLK